jgi:hypothetical protein
MIQNIISPIVLSVSSVSVGGVLLFKEIRDKSKRSKTSSINNSTIGKKPQQSLQSGQSSKDAISGLLRTSQQSGVQQQQKSQRKQQKQEQQEQQQQQSSLGTTRPTRQQMNDRSLLFKPDTLPRAEYTIAAYESDGPKRMDPLIREHNSDNNEGLSQPPPSSFRRGIDSSANNSDNSDSEQQQQQQRGGPNRLSPQAIRRLMNSD